MPRTPSGRLINRKHNTKVLMIAIIHCIKDGNSKILEQIISIEHYDIIFSCHFNSSKILSAIDPTKPGNTTEFYKYYMSGLIGAFVGFLITWISNGKTLTSDELIEMMMAYGDDNAMRFFM